MFYIVFDLITVSKNAIEISSEEVLIENKLPLKFKLTYLLTLPDWYLNLGKTMSECRSRYRFLFIQYLKSFSNSLSKFFKKTFIGESLWITILKDKIKQSLRNENGG